MNDVFQEFFNQSDMEKLEGLPVTAFMDPDKVTKPSSQCSFIGFVLLPLFEVLASSNGLFPYLEVRNCRHQQHSIYYITHRAGNDLSQLPFPRPQLQTSQEIYPHSFKLSSVWDSGGGKFHEPELIFNPLKRLSYLTCLKPENTTKMLIFSN